MREPNALPTNTGPRTNVPLSGIADTHGYAPPGVVCSIGQHELRCNRALSHLAEFAPSLKVLGSYPSVVRTADAGVPQDARAAGGLS
jgi:hypothetical protein